MVKKERKGQIYYVHAPKNKMVSKVCGDCSAIKLVEDFEEVPNGYGVEKIKAICKKCEDIAKLGRLSLLRF